MSAKPGVDLARLKQLLAAYGADPARWPESERTEARDLLAGSPEARQELRKAAELDALLDSASMPPPSPALMAAILAKTPGAAQSGWLASLWPFGPLWKPASALLLAGALGIATGLWLPSESLLAGSDFTSEVDSLLFDPTSGPWSFQ